MNILREISRNRLLMLRVGLVLVFLMLMARFFYVQILEGDRYLAASEENRVKQVELKPPRGLIRDRAYEILVDNRPAYSVYAIPSELQAADSTMELLGTILEKSTESLSHTYNRRRRGAFQKVKIDRYISFEKLAQIEERKLDLPGVFYDIEPRRSYPAGVLAPHLFGYLGEISERELEKLRADGYEQGDVIGIKGVEKVYEDILRGKDGYRFMEVDALGREVQVLGNLGEKLPVPGKDIILTIDAPLQRHLEQVMQDRLGGAVVLNCQNGQIIAMVSKPDYDPDIFTKPIPPSVWNSLNNNPDKPLYDRILQGLYPPGSVYKIILAIAALETGTVNPKATVFCPGGFRLGRRFFGCWNRAGHGNVNMRQAIEQSCNVYFYRIMQRVGLENWVKYSKLFRFGQRTNVDLTGEAHGLLPDSLYFDKAYGKGRWSQGLLLNLAIGQGDLLATPLQVAFYAMSLANRGKSFRPFIVKEIFDPLAESEKVVPTMPDTVHIRGISASTWDFIHQAMYDVVNGAKGTAKSANPGLIKVAGKTGTAQAPKGDDHAWFIGFAPFENPQVAFAIFLENGGGGGANAAPIARSILKLLLDQGKIQIPNRKFADAHVDQ
ncbi:MAG: penicillin-binding protein 2 [Deferribacteres bacterium]|nr:penicillin-binding protein 2 [candidate division KSB1 bacterium]MCB9510252.1 penicillin-binding protein 2 [Deferribacteres bacterium]